jgi:hypothetical protein
MNGVHCQMRTTITIVSGNWPIQSTGPIPTRDSTQFRIPLTGSRIVVFQISAAATGVTRNGVINSVRMTPRPRNARSSSNASSRPRTADTNTTTTISRTVFSATLQNWLSLTTAT